METDSNWTDATQSVNDNLENEEDDDIWVVDEEVMDAMDYDSGEEEI